MKDYEALSRMHFDSLASEYDARETAYYSKFPKISCRDVAKWLCSVFNRGDTDLGDTMSRHDEIWHLLEYLYINLGK